MTAQIHAPWTPEQVAALNRFQAEGGMHPFTCGGDHAPGSPALIAYTDGWRCQQPYGESCDYRQDWAHAFMADPKAWPKPFADLRQAAATEVTEPATITDPEWLRQQYAAAVQPLLMDNLPKPIAAARARDIADTVLFVRDRHLAQLRQRLELADADLGDATPPQDGPHAPQDGPQRPDAGAETPDGAGGRQAATEPVDEAQRDRLAEWLWDNCGEDERSGLLTDDPRKIAAVVLRWPEIAEQSARTTVNNPAASGELRNRIAAELHSWLNEPDGAKAWDEMAAEAADVALGALEQHLDIGEEQAWCKTCRRVWEGKTHRCESDAEQCISQIREKAVEWAALAPADDWGDTPQDTALADVGRYLLNLIEKPLKEQP